MAEMGCNCNASYYLVSLPGYDKNQHEDPGAGGDYYCDSNMVSGVWCWEHDIMEANMYNYHVTPHTCSKPEGKFIPECSFNGVSEDIYSKDPLMYGPGDKFKIDT